MAGFRVEGNTSGNVAEVTANNELKVALGQAIATMGGAINYSQNDDGTALGTQTLKSPETSQDYRLRVGMDSVLFRDTFNATTQNTSLWFYLSSTMTATQPGAGTINFGTVQGTAAGHGALIRSWRYFPVIGTAPLAVEFTAGVFNAALIANETWAMGVGNPSAAGTLPTDGVFLRLTSAGWELVARYNSTETTSGIILAPGSVVVGELNKWALIIGEQEINVWKDDVLLHTMALPPSQGQFFMQASQPVFAQKICTGSVSNTNTMRVSDITVTLMDLDSSRDWPLALAGAGGNAIQAANGFTNQGPTVSWANSANPTAFAPTNTTTPANCPTGLGGQGVATLWNLAATDMIMAQFLNPTPGVNTTGKTLYVTGCRIAMAVVSAALTAPAAGTHLFQWGIGVGGTQVSIAPADSASFASSTSKAHRRKALGLIAITNGTAPIGTPGDRTIDVTFSTPLVINPGEYLTLICKMLNGAATATGAIHYVFDFDGFWE